MQKSSKRPRLLPRPDRTAQARTREAQTAKALAQAFAGAEQAERDRLLKIINMVPCYVALVKEDHSIAFENKAFQEFFGPSEGKPCYTALRALPAPCAYCPPLDALASRSSCVLEWVYPKTRHVFRVYSYPFEDTDGTISVLKVGFNVTAGVRVQQALDLSEQSYRTITDNLAIGIAMLNLDLTVTAGNSRLVEWFGHAFSPGRRLCDILRCNGPVPGKGEFCPDCPFRSAAGDKASHEKEFTVSMLGGKERTVRLVACPVAPRRGKVRALIMMLEDITSRLRVNQQLQRARKLEAMSTLAGGIAHEINQPLSALHLYASGLQMLMEKQGELSRETTQERLALIMREAEKIRSIITHMRALVMQEKAAPTAPVAVKEALNATLALMGHQFTAHGIEVLTDIPEDLPLVRSNMVQLEQVLLNLFSNAVHALGSVNPKTKRRILAVSARTEGEGKRVRLEVADSGPGLAKGSERIFDPFYTTKDPHQGMGIGLPIVHSLVRLWGGEVSARPRHKVLGGAAFYVVLHAAGAPATDAPPPPKELPPA